MVKSMVLAKPCSSGALGIIRVQTAEDLVRIAKALYEGGLSCLEITMTTPGALGAIEKAREELPEVLLMGAGTVLDAATARQAILAGAQFLVTPTVALDVIETAHRYGVPVIPGAMTPTEILTAWEAGADMVCAGGWLVGKKAVAEGRYEVLTKNARRLVEAVRKAREL